MELVDRLLQGDRRAAARLISMIENRAPDANEAVAKIHAHTGKAHIVGITGPPGTGKSTLVSAMTQELRKMGKTVGILAVDPSSPFTGGAILGDRIRMGEICLDPEVYIRSMGSRGNLGGLSWATNDAVKVLDALGKDIVIVETVGAGQSEVDIVKTAHTCIVVAMPGLGDDIQAIKAGLMEIGDIFAVNKADIDGADRQKNQIEAMLHMAKETPWQVPVIMTVGWKGDGVPQLVEKMLEHHQHLTATGRLHEKETDRSRNELEEVLDKKIDERVHSTFKEGELEELVRRIKDRDTDPYTAADEVLNRVMKDKV